MASYRHLLEPIVINGMTVKNRVVMTPMGTHLASADGTVTKELIHHLEARAEGGVGLIIVEGRDRRWPGALQRQGAGG